MYVGVDEAGKGPVLGSMFAAAVAVPERAVVPEGVADSKRLTPTRREELAERLHDDERICIGIAEITPERIDDSGTDMNSLTVTSHAEAIDDVLCNDAPTADVLCGDDAPTADVLCGDDAPTADPVEVLCDAGDVDEARFARRVTDACSTDVTLSAYHGADDDDPLVAAASIVAKVERDAHVAALASRHGDLGSGYPSDPTTRSFLKEYVDEEQSLPPFARSSWRTCEDLLAAAEQSNLEEF